MPQNPKYHVRLEDGMHHAVLTHELWGDSVEGISKKREDAIVDCALKVCRVLHSKGSVMDSSGVRVLTLAVPQDCWFKTQRKGNTRTLRLCQPAPIHTQSCPKANPWSESTSFHPTSCLSPHPSLEPSAHPQHQCVTSPVCPGLLGRRSRYENRKEQ